MVEAELLRSFQRHGYAVLRGVMPSSVVRQLRDELLDPTFDALFAQSSQDSGARYAIGRRGGAFKENSAVARAMSPLLLDSRVLSFAEAVVGTSVQLDSFRVTCFPSLAPEHRGAVELAGWHVDRFSHSRPAEAGDWTPRRPAVGAGTDLPGYCPPRAVNCIGYLQDMDEISGPLRVVIGSHLESADHTLRDMAPVDSLRSPLPDEQLVHCSAGDVVVLHCDALHTGSSNTSGAYRYFVSSYLSQPTDVIRSDFPRAEGPRDDLRCDEITAFLAEWDQHKGQSAWERERVRHLFGRL